MRYNNLKAVQLILSSMDSDEVSSVGDTVESLQILDILETTYNDLASTIDFPDHWDFFELIPSGDPTRPTLMKLPDGVANVEWIQYDHALNSETTRQYTPVTPMERQCFFDRMNGLDHSLPTVYNYQYEVDTGTFDVRGRNDSHPRFYTTGDDRTILFDSYLATEDTTLQGNKTHCYGMRVPSFSRTDSFIPDFQPRQFSLYFNEAKSQAFVELKQVQNAKSEQRARRGWVHAHRTMSQTPPGDIKPWKPNYGRK